MLASLLDSGSIQFLIFGVMVIAIFVTLLITTPPSAAYCPDGTMTLTGTRTACIARDEKGKCTAFEQRQGVYCAPGKRDSTDENRVGPGTKR